MSNWERGRLDFKLGPSSDESFLLPWVVHPAIEESENLHSLSFLLLPLFRSEVGYVE